MPEARSLTEPLSSSEISQRSIAMAEARGKFDAAFVDSVMNFPPCQGSPAEALRKGYRPEDCLFGRGKLQSQGRTDRVRLLLSHLVPMVQSLELEAGALPANPVERVKAAHLLRSKYITLTEQQKVRNKDAGNRLYVEEEPLRRIGGASEGLLFSIESQLKSETAVRRAYVEGRLSAAEINLTKAEVRSWDFDKQTLALARRAASDSGSSVLFMDRQIDLNSSDREQRDAGQFARWGEPSANEMGLAVLRAFTKVGAARGELRAPYEARTNVAHQAWVARVAHVEKQSCAKQAPGYRCKLRLWMHGFVGRCPVRC